MSLSGTQLALKFLFRKFLLQIRMSVQLSQSLTAIGFKRVVYIVIRMLFLLIFIILSWRRNVTWFYFLKIAKISLILLCFSNPVWTLTTVSSNSIAGSDTDLNFAHTETP